MKIKIKNEKAITLIALVVSIIVLLIFAGIGISMLTGQNGILNKTIISKQNMEEAQEKEGIEIAVTSSKMEDSYSFEITESSLEKALKNEFGNNVDFLINDNEDGSFTITFNDTERMYYIKKSGEIIEDDNIFKIKSAEELKRFRDDVNQGNTYEGKYVYLANDINLDINQEWIPIGIYTKDSPSPDFEENIPFMGTFDGGGHEINGIYINSSEKVKGLFAFVKGATIKNLIIGQNCNINGYLGTASIAGYAYEKSTIYNCSNNSDVYGDQSTGGIVGILVNSTIKNSSNTARINGKNNIGGIAGYVTTNSQIYKCYNNGEIDAKENYAGGISGYTYTNSKVYCSYNKGNVNGTRNNWRNYRIHKI